MIRSVLAKSLGVIIVLSLLYPSVGFCSNGKISDTILAHRKAKIRPPGVSPLEHAKKLRGMGLNPNNLSGEDCALYVKQRLRPNEIAGLRRNGVVVHETYIPSVPGKHANGFHLATVSYSALDYVRQDARIVRLESTEFTSKPLNNLAAQQTNVDLVHAGIGVTARTGVGVKIAIADSGLDLTHGDIPTLAEAYDMTDGTGPGSWGTNVSNTVTDHGTHVTGSAVGSGALSGGTYAGAAPGATLYFYKIGDDETGSAYDTDMIEAINRAAAVGCKVFSMSYGGTSTFMDGSGSVCQAIDAAEAAGMACFISAGNEQDNGWHYSVEVPPEASTTFGYTISNDSPSVYKSQELIWAMWIDGQSDENIALTCSNLEAGESLVQYSSDVSSRGTEGKKYVLTPNVGRFSSKTYNLTLTNSAVGDYTAYDSAGDKHGTVYGAQWVNGVMGRALDFDGVSSGVGLPDNWPVWLPEYDFTCSLWVRFNTPPTISRHETLLDLNATSSSDPVNDIGCAVKRIDTGEASFGFNTFQGVTHVLYSDAVLDQGRWYHIVALRNATSQELYIDGRLEVSGVCADGQIDYDGGSYDDDGVNIGRATTNNSPNGAQHADAKMDDVRIYDVGLSADEVEQLYGRGDPGGLLGHWKFDESGVVIPRVHLYQVGGEGTFDAADSSYTITYPAVADTAVAVGAWTQRRNWTNYEGDGYYYPSLTVDTLAWFSSLGPRIDGLLKPDIVAPGAATISARDSEPGLASEDALIIDNDGLNLNGSGPADYYVNLGTSMACPHAAGLAALVLEANPSMTPGELRQRLTSSASSAHSPDNSVGYGLLNALAALEEDNPPAIIPTAMKGISYTAWGSTALSTASSDASIEAAYEDGVDWVALCVWEFQDSAASTVIAPDYSSYSATPESVADAIRRCHELGLNVMLKPMIDCTSCSWRGEIQPSSDWFIAYQAFVDRWARIAQDNSVEMFCVGCELQSTTSWSASWRCLCSQPRE
jgi:subtilisin family serine protease